MGGGKKRHEKAERAKRHTEHLRRKKQAKMRGSLSFKHPKRERRSRDMCKPTALD